MGMTSMTKSPPSITTTTISSENPAPLRITTTAAHFGGIEAREAIKLGDAALLETIMRSGQVDPNYRDGHGFSFNVGSNVQ